LKKFLKITYFQFNLLLGILMVNRISIDALLEFANY